MTEARWEDVFSSAHWAARHFNGAARILEQFNFDIREDVGYANSMAFFHAMQLGHTALEEALIRILLVLNEDRPIGERWHSELISQCSNPSDRRPAIISRELAIAANQTRMFRHRAAHATVQFEFVFSKERALLAAAAGEKIAAGLEPAIREFVRGLNLDIS